jgi:hypothetical protein
MVAGRIYLLLALNGFFLAPLSKLQSAQETKKGFHLPDILDMYSSHQGQLITAIGLSQNELTEVLSTVLRYDFVKESDVRSPTALKKELLARHVDMGEGANNGLVVQGTSELCGGTGNCVTWFFRKSGAKWQLLPLARRYPPDSAAFAFISPKHNGLLDLVLVRHMSADDAPVDVWQFNGAKYELVKSYCSHGDGRTIAGKCP